jgi:hypothetical protein
MTSPLRPRATLGGGSATRRPTIAEFTQSGHGAPVRPVDVGQGAGTVKSWSGNGLLSGTLITTISCPVA